MRSICTSTCGRRRSSSCYDVAPARRTSVAGSWSPRGSRRTRSARATTTSTGASTWIVGRGSASPASASPPRSGSSRCRATRPVRSSGPGTTARADLPEHFAAWASVPAVEPDLVGLTDLLGGAFVGVQLPATALGGPAGWDAVGEVLRVAELSGKPVFVHPGPAPAADALPRGGHPSSATSPSCRPPGGPGTRSVDARSSPGCGSSSRPARGWHPSTTSGSPPVGDGPGPSTPRSSSTRRRTARRGSTRFPGPWASTRSCWAATGPMPNPSSRSSARQRPGP